jgi:hypothetical protein
MSDKKTEEVTTKRARKSSDYIRVVGDVTIAVINTRQRPDDVPKTYRDKKWVVMTTAPTKSGGLRRAKVCSNDKKYDAIRALLDHEIALKAALKEKNDKSSQ